MSDHGPVYGSRLPLEVQAVLCILQFRAVETVDSRVCGRVPAGIQGNHAVRTVRQVEMHTAVDWFDG